MSKIILEIVTPEGAVFNEGVDEVILPGTQGELGVLPGHVPLMTTLGSGRLIAIADGVKHRFAVHGGFAEVLPEKVVILTEASELAGDIDSERAKTALATAEEALKNAEAARGEEVGDADPAEMHRAALERARARLIVSDEDKD